MSLVVSTCLKLLIFSFLFFHYQKCYAVALLNLNRQDNSYAWLHFLKDFFYEDLEVYFLASLYNKVNACAYCLSIILIKGLKRRKLILMLFSLDFMTFGCVNNFIKLSGIIDNRKLIEILIFKKRVILFFIISWIHEMREALYKWI